MDLTPNLALPYIVAAQAQKHVTHNEAIRSLDALVHLVVADKDIAAPPASPVEGRRYIVAAGPTGAWSGHAGHIAAWQDGGWIFYAPVEGFVAWVADEDRLYAFDGGGWTAAIAGQTLPMLGINATADATNRLAVAGDATLLTHAGGGHQVKLNKSASGATGSILFQTAYSGRAEIGLTGDDDLHVKVSADGTSWRDAMRIDRASGRVEFPSGGAVGIRTSDVTVNVPGQYPTIQQALDALLECRLSGGARGIVALAAGTYVLTAPLRATHPQPGHIVVRGPSAVTVLADADVAATRSATEVTVRARYAAVIECQGCSGVVLGAGEGLALEDVALIKTGSGSAAGADLVDGAYLRLTRSVVLGVSSGIAGRHATRSVVDQGTALLHSDQHGATLDTGAGLRTTGAASLIMRNGLNGIRAAGGSRLDLSLARIKSNGASGVLLETESAATLADCDVQANGGNGVQAMYQSAARISTTTVAPNTAAAISAGFGSTISATSITVAGTTLQSTLQATAASLIASSGTHSGTPVFDPALGTTANSGSWTV